MNYLSVLLRKTQKAYYFNNTHKGINIGDDVLVKTSHGIEAGEVIEICCEEDLKDVASIEGKVVRKFRADDYRKLKEFERKEKHAYEVCEKLISELGLPMKLLDVEWLFDGKKAIFYFSADGRVDFRELVRKLARRLKIRVEMRQVGVRDEAKMIGGLGPCGRDLCCATFLTQFEPMSVKMAKEQGLPLNTFKISGLCGRLMCCLKYEYDNYVEFAKKAPPIGSEVVTPEGKAKVVDYQVVLGGVTVEYESGVRKEYKLEEIEWEGKAKEVKQEEVKKEDVEKEEVKQEEIEQAKVREGTSSSGSSPSQGKES